MSVYQFSPYAIPPAVTAGVVLLFAVVVLLKRFSRIALAMAGMSLAVAGWQLAFVMLYLSTNERTAKIWVKVGCACLTFIAPAVYQFVASILEPKTYRRIIARIGWLTAVTFAVLILASDYLVAGVQRLWWGFYPAYDRTARPFYFAWMAALFVAALADMIRAYPAAKGIERRRIALFTLALGVGSTAAVNGLPVFGIAIYPFGWLALLAFTAIAIYTVMKYGMIAITPTLAANEIIRTMRDLLLVSDGEGRIEFANNAACAFLGYNREDIIGRHLEDFLAPSDETLPPLQGQWVRDREYVFRTKMGQPIELTLSSSPVSERGEVKGAVIIGRDLRERKRYEWEARRAVTLLESTLDSTADGILVIGQEGKLMTWNQRFADMFGIPAELMDHEEDRDVVAILVKQLVEPKEFLGTLDDLRAHPEVESVHVLQLKDGRRLEQYSIGRYLDNAPLRVWSFRDVTARLAAEEALRDSEGRYRLLFEQNAAGVCLAAVSGPIIDSNATFAAMVGSDMEQMKKRDLRDVFDRSATLDEIMHKLEDTPTVRGVEIELRHADGTRVNALANVSLVGRGEHALLHMTAVDISDRKRAEEQIEFQAYHDSLTQLPNRRLFVERLELSLLSAKRARGKVAVLFIDLDRFKTINDTLGHSVADALLIEVATRLRECVRQTDTVARYGGDEFTLILPDLHQPEDAAQVAEKILECMAEPIIAAGTSIEISVSIGIAVYPYDGTDFDTLVRNADDAMYRAKKAGRNQYQLCTEQMKTRASERLSMQSRLRKAMEDGELVLAYEPQVSLTSGLIVGAEAMVRWNDPERGVIESSEFIPVAEDTRLIVPLGEWTLLCACRQLRAWHDAGLRQLRMAVNISARQFQQRDLNRIVRRAIEDAEIDPALLELEVRETTAMRDVDVSIETLTLLRDVGVSVALNDFGSGYSALGSLQVLPINAVKIDRRFLQSETTATGNTAVVGAVIDVGRTLGLRVAADGVETREQAAFLRQRGCHEAQGPYFSAPIEEKAFALLLSTAAPLPPDSRARAEQSPQNLA